MRDILGRPDDAPAVVLEQMDEGLILGAQPPHASRFALGHPLLHHSRYPSSHGPLCVLSSGYPALAACQPVASSVMMRCGVHGLGTRWATLRLGGVGHLARSCMGCVL